MKRIDTRGMRVVHFGREWPHPVPPSHRSMTPELERNERLVYWLQPKDGGVRDQIPALKLPDGYYTMSLRIMKLVYRNIRLRKGFNNIEAAQMGGHKLRIPLTLLSEKTRTQSRFTVEAQTHAKSAHGLFLYFNHYRGARVPQTMRTAAQQKASASASASAAPPAQQAQPPQTTAAAKPPMTAASKVAKIVEDFFLPMTDGYFPPYTPFTVCPAVEEQAILERIAELFPGSTATRDTFVETAGTLYDRGTSGGDAT